MSIWFYIFIILLIICIVLILKLLIMKLSLRNIIKKINKIIESDTNNLITVSTNDKDIITFAIEINKSLEKLRNIELEYKQGSLQLKHSITDISHDLRTPLTAIKGYLDILEIDNLTDKQKKFLKIINDKTNNLIYLTEELFDYSIKLDNYQNMDKTEVCFNTVLEEVLCSYYVLFKEYNITPKIEICDEKVIRVVDLNSFKRILENILTNALKYSEKSLFISLKCDGSISFINKTTKLDRTSLEKMFDRYYTVENGKKSNGIGLSIVKQLTELNGGTIEAKYDNNQLSLIVKF